MNTYRALSEYGLAIFGKDIFEADFAPVEEKDHIDGGHLEIVPRTYRVLSDNYAAAAQGELVNLALPVEVEAAQMAGGHIERVDKPPAKKAAKAAPEKKD